MNNEINQFKVQANDPYFTANKWNETLDYSINFEKMIKNILGPKFKGIYKVSNQYDKYDYVWYDDSIYQIIGTSNATMNISNSYGLTNVYKYKDGLLGLNQRKEIVYYTNKENIIINNSFDSFCADYISGECFGLKDNRIYHIDLKTKEVELFNLVFGEDIKIEKILCDESHVYIKSKNKIYASIYLDEESTLIDSVVRTQNQIVDFDISNNYIFVVDLKNGVSVVRKTPNKRYKEINVAIDVTTDVRICSINDNTFALYDGRNNIFTYFDNGSGIFNLESTVVNYDGFNKGISSLTKNSRNILAVSLNNSIVSIPSIKYSIVKVDIKHVFSKNSNIDLDHSTVACYLPYKDGYYTHKGYNYLKQDECNFELSNLLPTVSNNSQITFDFNSVPYYKTIMLKLKTSSNGKNIGTLFYNNVSYQIKLPEFQGNEITVFLEYSKDKIVATYITEDKIIEDLDLKSSNISKSNILQIKSEYATSVSEVILFMSELEMDYKDYLSNNVIIPMKDVIVKPVPYSKVHLDNNGNLPVKLKNSSLLKEDEGLSVNISNDYRINNGEVAFSTAGANALYEKIITAINETLEEFSGVSHTHEFSELKNVPIATQSNKGIVSLAYSVSDSNNTAITPLAVKSFGDTLALKNHVHDFYDLNGIPNATTGVKGIVKLQNSINSESSTACTPSAVNTKLGEYLHKSSGGTIGGTLNTNNLTANSFSLGGWKIEVVRV